MSPVRRTVAETADLLRTVVDAASGMTPVGWAESVLGRLVPALPWEHSEYALLTSPDVVRSARWVADVGIPSLHRRPPRWLPPGLRSAFFHETTLEAHPDPAGDYDSFPEEEWIFINGILTNAGMAHWNARLLGLLFGRPMTIVQNATDGPLADLIECANEKAFGMSGEPVDVGFPAVHRALTDPSRRRVIIIAHSQGTLIVAAMLRLLRLLYERRDQLLTPEDQAAELEALRRQGVTLDLDDFRDITVAELRRLEVYAFANCASDMRYVDAARRLPWIESFGNEHDLVARLGMLGPRLEADDIHIDGPRWVHRGAWGHLLNSHYLRAIHEAQAGGSHPGPRTPSADPYELGAGIPRGAPRLFQYINGGVAED